MQTLVLTPILLAIQGVLLSNHRCCFCRDDQQLSSCPANLFHAATYSFHSRPPPLAHWSPPMGVVGQEVRMTTVPCRGLLWSSRWARGGGELLPRLLLLLLKLPCPSREAFCPVRKAWPVVSSLRCLALPEVVTWPRSHLTHPQGEYGHHLGSIVFFSHQIFKVSPKQVKKLEASDHSA